MATWARTGSDLAKSDLAKSDLAKGDERFNFHREEDFGLAEEFLRGAGSRGEGPSVLLLSADGRGAGRSYFLDVLEERLSIEEARPVLWRLDLSGFEPDHPQAMAAYLSYQLDKRTRQGGTNAALVETAKALSRAIPPTESGAILAALLLELAEPLEALGQLGQALPLQAIDRLLDELAEENRVLLHVVDFAQLSGPMRRQLVEMAERRRSFFLALSCGFADRTEGVAPQARYSVLRLEIEPLSQNELRQLVERRLPQGQPADALSDALWRATDGAPARLGPRLAELVAQGKLVFGEQGASWQMPEPAAFAEAESQSGDIEKALDAVLIAHPEIAKALRSLLLYGALCGEVFPPKVLLERMGIDEDVADEVVDLIDEALVEQHGWIEDLEYRHPGFPGQQVYRFAQTALPSIVLLRVGPEGSSGASRVLLEALGLSLPPYTRAIANLHLELSRHLGPAYQKPHLDLLSWWTSPDQAEQLETQVRQRIEQDDNEAEPVWQVLQNFRQHWPPHRRFALLNAYLFGLLGARLEDVDDAELARKLPQGQAARCAMERARLLLDLGHTEAAVDAAARARRLAKAAHGEASAPYVGASYVSGLALKAAGSLEASRDCLAEVYAKIEGVGIPEERRADIAESYADVLSELGEKDKAREIQEKVLETRRSVHGLEHLDTLEAMEKLALTYYSQNECGLARALQDEVLETRRRLLGPDHPQTLAALWNLAITLMQEGESELAATMLDQAVADMRRVLGPKNLVTQAVEEWLKVHRVG